MQLRKNILNLSLISLGIATFGVACSDDDPTPPDSGMPPVDAGTPDAGPMAGDSFQDQALAAFGDEVIDGTGIILRDNLAVDTATAGIPAPDSPVPAGLETVPYYGAVDPSTTTPAWWQGWTYVNPATDGSLPGDLFHPLQAEIETGTITPAATNACTTVNADFADGGTVTVFGASFPVCVISQNIEANASLPNNHVFLLDGTINVGTGDVQLAGGDPTTNVTLTIEEGTQIYGVEGTASALVITRGSTIEANGSAAMPIIMASVEADTTAANVITGDPTDLTKRALDEVWGGLVLSGFGIVNSGSPELLTEAAPEDQERWYGGEDNADNSGTVQYVIIAESGFEFREDAEVQGLTLEGAGSGTTIDYVQVVGSEDDCVEWFGGAAPIRHLICNGVDDDGLDIDLGYVGNIQFAIIRIGSLNGENGIESDNNSNITLEPISAPNIANITILGNPGKDAVTRAALHREGFAGKLYRSVYMDDTLSGGAFEDGCIDIDDSFPQDVGSAGVSLEYFDVVMNCTGGNASASDDDDS